MASRPLASNCQKAFGESAPGNRQPMPTTAIGSSKVGGRDWLGSDAVPAPKCSAAEAMVG